MRELIILRGLPGAGKSTWIKNMELEDYTLSPDTLRMMFSSPECLIDGSFQNNQGVSSKAWNTMYEMLEKRMSLGCTTVVDATHLKQKYYNKYKKYADKYRYGITVVDFFYQGTLVDALRNNEYRKGTIDYVPPSIIKNMYESAQKIEVPSSWWWVTPGNFSLDEYPDEIKAEKLVFIGDIHGCFNPLLKYFKEHPFSKDNHYVFLGDYIDRGNQNNDVLNYLNSIRKYDNVTLLEGNHERHLWSYAMDETANSKEFENKTRAQLEACGFTKEMAREFVLSLKPYFYATFNGQRVFACHGGIPGFKDNWFNEGINLLSARQVIKGVGNYEDMESVAQSWSFNHPGVIQVFGHRNVNSLPAKINEDVYCLEGKVEFNGSLRVLTMGNDGVCEVLEIPNVPDDREPEGKKREKTYGAGEKDSRRMESGFEEAAVKNELEFIQQMKDSSLVKERKLPDGISSLNFTRNAFYKNEWNELNVKARGMFVDEDGNIIARSYDKFFNLEEVPETTIESLRENLVFPVKVYQKENGFLGILSVYNGELLYCSKSQTYKSEQGDFARMFKTIFEREYAKNVENIKKFISSNNVSMIFEVVSPKDRHILDYSDESKCFLLDIVYNKINVEKFPYIKLQKIAKKFGLPWKHTYGQFNPIAKEAFFDALKKHAIEYPCQWHGEGWVYEDARGFQFKQKTNFYKFWKMVRGCMKQENLPLEPPLGMFREEIHNKIREDYKMVREYLLARKENGVIYDDVVLLRRDLQKRMYAPHHWPIIPEKVNNV
jgi:hypothetical protein